MQLTYNRMQSVRMPAKSMSYTAGCGALGLEKTRVRAASSNQVSLAKQGEVRVVGVGVQRCGLASTSTRCKNEG